MQTSDWHRLLSADLTREDFLDRMRELLNQSGGRPAARIVEEVRRTIAALRRTGGTGKIAGDSPDLILQNLAATFDSLGCLDDAYRTYQEALEGARKRGDRLAEAEILRKLGRLLRKQSRWEDALSHVAQSRTIAEEMGDRAGVVVCRLSEGIIASERGNYPSAAEVYRSALVIAEELGLPRLVMAATQNLGIVETVTGDLDNALIHLNEALSLATPEEFPTAHARALHNLGMCYIARRDWKESLDAFDRALARAEELGDLVQIGSTCTQKAAVYAELGDLSVAATFCARGYDIFRTVDFPAGKAETWKVLGRLMVHRQGYVTADSLIQDSLNTFRDLGMPLGEAEALRDLGRLASAKADKVRAREFLQEACDIFERIGARHELAVSREMMP